MHRSKQSQTTIIKKDIVKALKAKNYDQLKALLKLQPGTNFHIEINKKRSKFGTPLHLATLNDWLKGVRLLYRNNADLNARTTKDETALHLAIQYKHLEIVSYLLRKAADCNLANRKGIYPLHLAAQYGIDSIVTDLYINKADLNVKNRNGDTPLHVGIKYNSYSVINHLMRYEVDINTLNLDGVTPLEEAVSRELWDIVDLLNRKEFSLEDANRLPDRPFDTLEEASQTETGVSLAEDESPLDDEVECPCCFTQTCLTQVVPCEGKNTHYSCFECVKRYAEEKIGKKDYNLRCLSTDGCGAVIGSERLQEALGPALIDNLSKLKAEAIVIEAGIHLEECPFCDFKAEYEGYGEFSCQNHECGITSCFQCRSEIHIGKTCEENKEATMTPYNRVVEAMNRAAINQCCPQCKEGVTKNDGCNKLICRCGAKICNVCNADISVEGYGHFSLEGCNLFEDPQDVRQAQRDEEKQINIQKAKERAIMEIIEEDPSVDIDALIQIRGDGLQPTEPPRAFIPYDDYFNRAADPVANELNDNVRNFYRQ